MKLPALLKKGFYGLAIASLTLLFGFNRAEKPKVLVFSKTEVFRHQSIEEGKSSF